MSWSAGLVPTRWTVVRGVDTASYATSAAGVAVSLVTGNGVGGDAEGDRLFNIENLTGSNFDDTLEGNAGNNVLVGGLGHRHRVLCQCHVGCQWSGGHGQSRPDLSAEHDQRREPTR